MKGRWLSYILIVIMLFAFAVATNAYECWQLDGDQSGCQAQSDDCMWSPSATDPWCPDPTGCCLMKGCWLNDGDQTSCEADSGCNWLPNNMNQNPGCMNDVGCCDKKGCWNFVNTNQTTCESSFGGSLCSWADGSEPWCPEAGGCCAPRGCSEYQNQTKCEQAADMFDMPCSWTGGACVDGGFSSLNGETECINSGGWWNPDQQTCEAPSGTGPMFGGDVHCWFADNQANVCTNITGCVYCTAAKVADSNSACYNSQIGWCQGHESFSGANDISEESMECDDIQLKQVCNCGPLMNCKWNSTNETQGQYCGKGVKTDDEKNVCQPPANFCDDETAKFNQTICNQLIDDYMMPCQWNANLTTPKCEFKSDMLFKDGPGGFEDIGSESSCTAAGGDWKTASFTDLSGIVKTDSWCEMGSGVGFEQCDDSCWACEFQPDGNSWASAADAQSACEGSSLGFCQWTANTAAFNGQGWCDFPTQFNNGGGNCQQNCKDCEIQNDPQSACIGSSAGCQWTGTDCMSLNIKTCNNDCFSCYDTSSCSNSAAQCTWNVDPAYCKPVGFSSDQEVCFDGIDNNNNGAIDCADSACSFDNFCGGNFLAGGMGGGGTDCKMRGMNQSYCELGETPMGNCSWIVTPWNEQFCDFPGAACWMSDGNTTACEATSGCHVINSSQEGGASCEVQKKNCFIPNSTLCAAEPGCAWVDDPHSPIGGFCDMEIFATCGGLDQSTCTAHENCTWKDDTSSMEGGFCDPVCFSLDASSCENATYSGICMLQDTMCEPDFFMGGCPEYDHNETECHLHNATCTWTPDQGGSPGDGWCDDQGTQMMFKGMDSSPPYHLGDDNIDGSIPAELDIMYFGIKDNPNTFAFGVGAAAMDDAAACNGVWVHGNAGPPTMGTGTNTTKYFWYLDTDGIATGGCSAYDQDGLTVAGFEFMIKHTARWQDGSLVETKNFFKCSNGSWVMTNLPLTSNQNKMCGDFGGVMVAVDKGTLENFAEYDSTKPMRIFVATATADGNRTSPVDSGPEGWYSIGSLDFQFECCDCPGQDVDGDGFVSEMDPDCKFVKKFGFVPFEECMDNIDNNGDGLVDCDDPQCANTPMCGSGFNFAVDATDKTSPSVLFSKVDAWDIGAFVKFDTNEPANGTVFFYKNDSTCATVNTTVYDLGDPNSNWDDYKPFHGAPLDNSNMNLYPLGYDLTPSTSYYYKVNVCDPSGNCAQSACLNFTTQSAQSNFVFKMDLPPGFNMDIPAWGMDDDNMTYGTQTNISNAQDINITVNCPDAGYSMTLVGVDVFAAKDLDFSTAFTCDTSDGLIGMNSTKWQSMLYELHVDYVLITWATEGDTVYHCDDNGLNCEDVTSYMNCTTGSSSTVCKIPVTLGFSTYKVSSSSSSSPAGGSSGGGGGGGGATGGTTYDAGDLTRAEVTLDYMINDQVLFQHDGSTHTIEVKMINSVSTSVEIDDASPWVVVGLGGTAGIDLDSDGKEDIELRLLGLTPNVASLKIVSLMTRQANLPPLLPPAPRKTKDVAAQVVPQEVPAVEPVVEPEPVVEEIVPPIVGHAVQESGEGNLSYLAGFFILVAIAIGGIVLAFKHGRRQGHESAAETKSKIEELHEGHEKE